MVSADPLRSKVLRDVLQLRGQMLAIVVVMASGVALFVMLRGMNAYLRDAQQAYYTQYRFADVFVRARRVPNSVVRQVAAVPGVESVQARIVFDVLLDVPGLPEAATGRLVSVPERRTAMLNDLHLRSGRYIEPGQPGEVVLSDAFAAANGLRVGSRFGAIVNGRWQTLRVVGTAVSPEYVYCLRGGGSVFPADPSKLEITADLVSTDAVKVRPGQSMVVEGWGGEHPLRGRVRLIEPSGFTKVSALGIEEQRVNVIGDLLEPAEWLGDRYRVQVRIVVWQVNRVLKMPWSALVREGDRWRVYVAEDGRARARAVSVGRQGEFEVQILDGIRAGELVVRHPTDQIVDGVRVRAR